MIITAIFTLAKLDLSRNHYIQSVSLSTISRAIKSIARLSFCAVNSQWLINITAAVAITIAITNATIELSFEVFVTFITHADSFCCCCGEAGDRLLLLLLACCGASWLMTDRMSEWMDISSSRVRLVVNKACHWLWLWLCSADCHSMY